MSGGEQQRVSIARAFVNRPLILLADEPTGNLDPAPARASCGSLDRINKTGTTIVMATHDQRIVNMMRRRVVQLDRGVIVRDQARGVYDCGRCGTRSPGQDPGPISPASTTDGRCGTRSPGQDPGPISPASTTDGRCGTRSPGSTPAPSVQERD